MRNGALLMGMRNQAGDFRTAAARPSSPPSAEPLHHELGNKGVRVQAVLRGDRHRALDNGGLPLEHVAPAIVLPVSALVDAVLIDFNRGERISIPSLHDASLWQPTTRHAKPCSTSFPPTSPRSAIAPSVD